MRELPSQSVVPAQTPASSVGFRLQARPSSAVLLRRRLEEWLASQGVSERELFDVLLAASEAFANAVEHPQRPAAAVVDVEATVDGAVLELTIRDYGAWRNERERAEGGLGFPIMWTVMQDVEIDSQSEGSTIRLRRRLSSLPG
jgi:anti-sigma regulatory factor (Ser/Thr protein kinase)